MIITRYYIRKAYSKGIKIARLPVEYIQTVGRGGSSFAYDVLYPSVFKPDRNTSYICYGDGFNKMELITVGFIESNWVELNAEVGV